MSTTPRKQHTPRSRRSAQHDVFDLPLPLLGGLSARVFLREYWQKKPLLVRSAIPGFVPPLTKREVFELATRDEAESRLFLERRGDWQVEQGPFTRTQLRDLQAQPSDLHWTILIQDTQHFSYEAHALLDRFNFIGRARIDDLMVSYANDGGGVGAHFDSYDVFLLQGIGQRRWQISAQTDLTLDPKRPVKILKKFRPEQEWVLNTGDMLYLPPHIAHHGVAVGECMTWSIGFRAPSQGELTRAFLEERLGDVREGEAYADPDLLPTETPGSINHRMSVQLGQLLSRGLQQATDSIAHAHFIGRYLTEPKQHVFFPPPSRRLSRAAFAKTASAKGLHLDLCSRLLADEKDKTVLYLNGQLLRVVAADQPVLAQLADCRTLSPHAFTRLRDDGQALLHAAFLRGELHLGQPPLAKE